MQALAPEALYLLAGQPEQADDDDAPTAAEKVPAGQPRHAPPAAGL